MTTTTSTHGPWDSPSTTETGNAGANAIAKAKAELEAKVEQKKQRIKNRQKNNTNNTNKTRYDDLVTDGIMKGMTILPGSSGSMTSYFMLLRKLGVASAAAKGYTH